MLLAVLALATPATAFAQSAGDEQYQDPFGDEQSQSDEQGTATPTPTPTPVPSSPGDSGETAQAPTATAAQSAPAAEQLPRTGEDAWLLALGGTVLLAGGVALRRRVD